MLRTERYPGFEQLHDDIMNLMFSKLPSITGYSKEEIVEFFKDDRYENSLDDFLNEVSLNLWAKNNLR